MLVIRWQVELAIWTIYTGYKSFKRGWNSVGCKRLHANLKLCMIRHAPRGAGRTVLYTKKVYTRGGGYIGPVGLKSQWDTIIIIIIIIIIHSFSGRIFHCTTHPSSAPRCLLHAGCVGYHLLHGYCLRSRHCYKQLLPQVGLQSCS